MLLSLMWSMVFVGLFSCGEPHQEHRGVGALHADVQGCCWEQ